MRTNTILLIAFFAGAISAAPSKTRLGQMGAKNNLAEAQAEWSGVSGGYDNCDVQDLGSVSLSPLECPCNFTELPGLGAGLSQGF